MKSLRHFSTFQLLCVCLLFISLLTLLFFSFLGIYDRPQNDDFYYLAKTGITPHDNFNWLTNGRIVSLISYYFLYPLPYIIQIAPFLTIVLIFTATTCFIFGILYWLTHESAKNLLLVSASGAGVASVGSILLLPGMFAAIYWFIALPPHTWSFCFLILYIGLLTVRLSQQKTFSPIRDLTVFLLLPAAIGTMYEAVALLLIASSATALCICVLKKKRTHTLVSLLSLVGSMTSLCILLFSPGAMRRRSLSKDINDSGMIDRLLELPAALLHDLTSVVPNYIQHIEFTLVIVLVGVALAVTSNTSIDVRKFLLRVLYIICGTTIFILCDMSVVWIGLGEHYAVREFFSLSIALSICSLLIGITLGQYLKTYTKIKKIDMRYIVLTLCGLSLLITSSQMFYVPFLKNTYVSMSSYATQWDSRDKYVKNNISEGACMIPVKSFVISGLWHPKKNPYYWVNNAISNYYGTSQNGSRCRIYAKDTVWMFPKTEVFELPKG